MVFPFVSAISISVGFWMIDS